MSIVDIQNLYDNLQLDKLMDDDCCLFLWTTNSMLPHAICALELWGFEYKTMITWIKPNFGMGFWYRNKTEHMLFGIKGKVKPFRFAYENIFYTQNQLKHSQKPQKSYRIVEQAAQMVAFDKDRGGINILELFARKQHKSLNDSIRWVCLGKEISRNTLDVDVQNLISLNANITK